MNYFLGDFFINTLKKCKILNGPNNLDSFVIVCSPPPEFTFLGIISNNDKYRIVDIIK